LKVDKENCHCFGSCKRSYDAIDIVAKGANCSISEAIDLLCEELGIIPANGGHSGGQRDSTKTARGTKRDYVEEFGQALRTKPPSEAMEYLERRKLSSMLSELQEKKLIGFKPGNGKFPPAIVIPVTSLDREILGLQYIPTDGSEKKFASGTEPGTYKDRGFFPLNRGDGEIVLVESVIDAISLAAAIPMKNAAAILSAGFIEKVDRYGGKTEPPILFFDRDEAGQKATAKAIEILQGRCKVVDWGLAPEGMKDVNDLLRAGQIRIIAKMVSDAKPPVAAKNSDSREPLAKVCCR
jgi:DNA primase